MKLECLKCKRSYLWFTAVGFSALCPDCLKSENLDALCRMMFDPENQPPQYDHADAWKEYKKITGSKPATKDEK